MKIKQVKNSNVIIKKRDDLDVRKVGNIVLPPKDDTSQLIGEVVGMGPGILLPNGQIVAPDFEIGDIVVYPNYGSTKMKLDKEEFIVTKQESIITTIEI